jgi:serine/threonine protein kinase
MKRICPRCSRISADGNLWCQEKFCPAEHAPDILEHGEWLGNIEIVKLITVLRSSAVYEARRGDSRILLKVAHDGCQEKLKREALLLAAMNQRMQHPMLPALLPAHEQAKVAEYPYGKIAIGGHTKYYLVFGFVDGDLLRNYLLKNPQPWYQHVGWMMVSLADVVAYIHQYSRLHLCLSPDVILVRFDSQKIPRPVLIDLGLADDAQNITTKWDARFAPPAYTAPELIEMKGKVGPATDVYGLGLILYEMLAGFPAYSFGLQRDEDIYAAILTRKPANMGRSDLKNIPAIAERAISRDYNARQKDVITFASELQANFPRVPRERKPFRVNWRTVAIVMATLLAISLLLVLALPV